MSILSELMKKRLSEAEAPPDFPIGHYRLMVKDAPSEDKFDSGWEILKFPCRIIEALDDVDEDDLAEYGDLSTTLISRDFFSHSDPEYARSNQQTHADLCAWIENDLQFEDDVPTEEAIAQVKGMTFIAEIGLRQDKNDPNRRYPEIKNTLPDSDDGDGE